MRLYQMKWDFERLPYALAEVDGPYQHIWLPVTRSYGRPGVRQWVDYEAHLDNAMVFARSPRLFKGVFVGDTTGRYLYLFDSFKRLRG